MPIGSLPDLHSTEEEATDGLSLITQNDDDDDDDQDDGDDDCGHG